VLFIAENDNDGVLEPGEGGLCAACHVAEWITDNVGNVYPPIFTDYTYDNIGSPKNPMNPFYDMPPDINPEGKAWVDHGLGGYLEKVPEYAALAKEQLGKMKVPTLRNVDKKPYGGFHKSYGHNGYFKSLEDIVHFYNMRDILPRCPESGGKTGIDCWPEPEMSMNVNTEELGKLALTEEHERAIVAFMKTLSDGYVPGK
jgi:cytochrome c peroxidase